jgi:hypothetical protein
MGDKVMEVYEKIAAKIIVDSNSLINRVCEENEQKNGDNIEKILNFHITKSRKYGEFITNLKTKQSHLCTIEDEYSVKPKNIECDDLIFENIVVKIMDTIINYYNSHIENLHITGEYLYLNIKNSDKQNKKTFDIIRFKVKAANIKQLQSLKSIADELVVKSNNKCKELHNSDLRSILLNIDDSTRMLEIIGRKLSPEQQIQLILDLYDSKGLTNLKKELTAEQQNEPNKIFQLKGKIEERKIG